MKLLLLTPYLPHPLAGHAAGEYPYHLIEHLAPRHEITLVSFCDEREMTLAPDLGRLPIRVHTIPRTKGKQGTFAANAALALVRLLQLLRSVLLWQPYYVSKFFDRRMARLVRDLTAGESFDCVLVEFTFMASYRSSIRKGATTVLQEIDVSIRPAYRRLKNASSLGTRLVAYVEWCRWMRYEVGAVRSFDHVLTVTDQDRMLLKKLTGVGHISYFAHAFDVPPRIVPAQDREKHTLLFLGSYAHSPNRDSALWLCQSIFPLVRRQYPDAKLFIAGPHAPSELLEAARKEPGVEVLGFVENLDAYLERCAVFAAPLRFGGGIKNKVLYAMARGLPVVATGIGVEGIDGLETKPALLAPTPEKFAEQIGRLFDDTALAAELSARGVELVRAHYSWENSVRQLESILASRR